MDVGYVPTFCDDTSIINIAKNPVQHKRTKHIVIKHHFHRNNIENGHVSIMFCSTEE